MADRENRVLLYQYCGHTGGNSHGHGGCSFKEKSFVVQPEGSGRDVNGQGKVGIKDGDKCIHCHLCPNTVLFLTKYGADIGDTG